MFARRSIAVLAALALAACGGHGAATQPGPAVVAPQKLYDRIGGRDALVAIVQDVLENARRDERLGAAFANVDVAALAPRLVEQLCSLTGGPCTYDGTPMPEAHAQLAITADQFDAFVAALVASFDKFGVEEPERGELLALVGGMKAEIVSTGAGR